MLPTADPVVHLAKIHEGSTTDPRCHQALLTGEKVSQYFEEADCPYCWVLHAFTVQRYLKDLPKISASIEGAWVDRCLAMASARTMNLPVAEPGTWVEELNALLTAWCATKTEAAVNPR